MDLFKRRLAKAQRQMKYLQNDLRSIVGMTAGIFKQAAGGARIITYHGICLADPLRFNASFITAATFEKHLQFYRQHFNIISLDDYLAGNISKDRYNVCLTFDDGHRNNLTYALPLLEKYRAPASFFITGIRKAGYDMLWNDFLAVFSRSGPRQITFRGEEFHKNRWNHYVSDIDGHLLREQVRAGDFSLKTEMMETLDPSGAFRQKNAAHADYWLQMTPDEILILAQSPYATIGAHSLYHNDLTKVSPASLADDFSACKFYLESTIQREVSCFAFPYGSYTPAVTEAGLAAGFKHFFALEHLFDEEADTPVSERLVVNPYISTVNQMLAIVSGHY